MTPRRQRMLVVVGIVVGVGIGAAVALKAFSGNLLYYYTPTQALAKNLGPSRVFRLGGLVEKGTVERKAGTLTVRFVVTDNRKSIPVVFTGVLPSLFRAGQGVIANGHLGAGGVFVANDVLAKHDSKYMPLKLYNKENGTAYRRPGAMDAKAGSDGG
ncbi:MAG: cytochrome c maturation protein CcmE [Gammaproteobacteria bacterium]